MMMDNATLAHLNAWADRFLRDEDRDATLERMVALYADDPDYYANAGWSRLWDQVSV